jgi:hypothetical protein
VDQRIILWAMNESEMGRSFLIDPFLSRHFGGLSWWMYERKLGEF